MLAMLDLRRDLKQHSAGYRQPPTEMTPMIARLKTYAVVMRRI